MKHIDLGKFKISNALPFVLIAGPCQIESLDHSLMIAKTISKMCLALSIPYIFKSSFDKANRTNIKGKRGIGAKAAIDVFKAIKSELGCPITTDVHNESQCAEMALAVDILQIPALLCRQTDLLKAAADTGKIVNIKKGQFLSPYEAKNITEKMEYFGNDKVILTERGVTFGYNNLVSDMRSLNIMSQTGYPVIFDATHSTQQPGGMGSSSGGQRHFAPILARAAIASTPIAGIFAEVHDNPDQAPSDGPCMIELHNLNKMLVQLKEIDSIIKKSI